VRVEDLDTARVVPGCAPQMLRTLEDFALTWDGVVEYQSAARQRYAEALARLTALGVTYECSCSRRERSGEAGYPGTCRRGPRHPGATATRLRVDDEALMTFEDRVQGVCRFELRERGDVIVRRRDGVYAYQLAVVVDDALQGVTDVVRGADLLDNTPWQMALQRSLALRTPRYAHLPLITEPGGEKLAKSRRSIPLDPAMAGPALHEVLGLLGQNPPAALKLESPATILDWACEHWNLDRVHGVRVVHAGAAGTP